jgi:hypothetical protein
VLSFDNNVNVESPVLVNKDVLNSI